MAEGTNCWAFLHKPLADDWEAWWEWYKVQVDPDTGDPLPEPDIHQWDKSRIRTMIHQDYAFHAYDPPQIWDGREWRLLNFYNISRGNINAGTQLHGDAFAGGDFNALGYWTWKSRDDEYSEQIKQIDYRPDIAVLFMPPVCTEYNQTTGECITEEPASEVTDVNLAAGQPPRDLNPNINLMQFVRDMEDEGWDIRREGKNRVRIVYNGETYSKIIDYLRACNFSDLPMPLANDIAEALQAQELCT